MTVSSLEAQTSTSPSPLPAWQAGETVDSIEAQRLIDEGVAFSVQEISPQIAKRIKGSSLPDGVRGLTTSDLRYLQLLHVGPEGQIMKGEMIVNRRIAADVDSIFLKLYQAGYPIESMRLIDDFGANDEKSMRANNTSAFCYRSIVGSARLSKHSMGMAIDINPLYNPYFKYSKLQPRKADLSTLQPSTAKEYVDRTKEFPYKITRDDLAVKLFKQYGFKWGGDWANRKDYQHFEK
ncbi:MAG: M15 family metallopeptidase [Bacteroidales bacterium]|nr:M15 family metallopeptidase [Bacteroidales bacterium]